MVVRCDGSGINHKYFYLNNYLDSVRSVSRIPTSKIKYGVQIGLLMEHLVCFSEKTRISLFDFAYYIFFNNCFIDLGRESFFNLPKRKNVSKYCFLVRTMVSSSTGWHNYAQRRSSFWCYLNSNSRTWTYCPW